MLLIEFLQSDALHINGLQGSVPTTFQILRYQTIFGFHTIVLAPSAFGFVLQLLQMIQQDLAILLRLLAEARPGLRRGSQCRRPHNFHHHLRKQRFGWRAKEAQALLAVFPLAGPTPTYVGRMTLTAEISNLQRTAAPPAAQQPR
jgi:hypothetical protein